MLLIIFLPVLIPFDFLFPFCFKLDLALRCLLDTNSLVKNVSGIIFATCCHHQCEWNTFVGKKTFLDWGFTEEEFRPLSGITSWNVCGTGTGKFANSSEDGNSLK